jgi:hypothetical protein
MFLTGIVQIIATEIYREFTRDQWDLSRKGKSVVELSEQEMQQREIDNAQKEFSEDGTVYLVTNSVTPGVFNEKKFIVKDKDNKILFEGKEEDNPYSFIRWSPATKGRNLSYQNINQKYLNELNLIGGEFSRYFVIPMVSVENKRIGHWFFDVDKRIFKYYAISGEEHGFLGTNGYTERKSEALAFEECFQMINWLRPNSYDPMMICQTEYAVYQIDFQNKQVDTLVKTDNNPIRRMVMNNWQEAETYDYRPSLAIFTNSNKFYLYLKNPEQAIESQLPSDFGYFDMPQFAASNKTIFAQLHETPGMPKINNQNLYIAWLQENRGKPIDRRVRLFEVDKTGTFSEKASFVWTQPVYRSNIVMRSTGEMIYSVVNSLSSPVPMWATRHWLKTGNYRQGPVWIQVIMVFIKAYSAFKTPINLCLMTAFAILAFLHGLPRRTHITKLIFWVVFVFLFNLPGFLTYLAMNHTPVIRCASCGKKRGLLQDACCRCQNPLPPPKSRETDLVVPLSA